MFTRKRPTGLLLKVSLALVVLALLAAAVGASRAAASSSPSPGTDSVLHIGWVQEPDNLNPFIGIQGTDYMLWHMNYDFLVGFDAKTLEPRPELATKWEVSPDGKVWTFTIRSDAKWQDGPPVTAKDVAFTFNYIVDNKLLNLAAYTTGIVKAVAVDDTHVQIYTSAPKANMLKMIVPILPEHIWSKVSGKAASTSYQNKPPIIGSGPFQITEWQRGKFVRLVANKNYWGGAPKVHEVIFQLYTNADTMTQDLKLGTIEGAIDLPTAQFKPLSSVPGITTNKATSWSFIELAMNCYDSPDSKGNPVLKDPQFRQAVNWAVDRQKVVDVAYQGYATLGSSLVVPYSKYHWEPPADQAFAYDPNKANAILDAAGYKDVNGDGYRETKDGKKLTLRFYATTDSVPNQTAGKLIVDWLRKVGIRLDFQVIDAGTLINYQYEYTGKKYTPNWDMFIWYWVQDVDPNFIVDIYTPQQIEGWNDCLWTDPEYTKLDAQQIQTIDEAKRIPIVQKMQQIFYQRAAYAILAYPYQLEAYNTAGWKGWVHVPGDAPGGQQGAVLYSYNNIDTYRFVEPLATTTAAKKPFVNWKWLAFGLGGTLILLGGMWYLSRRIKPKETE
ncbi:MAG TPA: ABC transporter substrate-binding protein [Thermoleophilia bacterium]|nr:ABC transporter substrate-binding protein [Thermoleophilia bacterium]